MRSNIFSHELRRHIRSIPLWLAAMLLFAGLFLGFYQGLVADSTVLLDLLDSFPEVAAKLAGFSEFAVTSVIGFFSLTMVYVVLIGSLQSANLGLGILAKETTNKTSDFILTKPVSRSQILSSKFLAGVSVILITNLVFIPLVFLMVYAFIAEPPTGLSLFLTSLSLPFIQLVFFSIGFWLATVLRKPKNLLATTLPLVFGFYIVGMLDGLIGKQEIRYFTPFKFFDFEYIESQGNYEWQFIFLGLGIIAITAYYSYRNYIRKDIPAVS